MASCWTLTGLVLLALSVIACGISFVAPYWIQNDGILTTINTGLWAVCKDNKRCTWFFEGDFHWQNRQPEWVKAAQGLFTFGIVTLLIGFLVMCVQLCCRCCGAKAYFCMNRLVTVFLFFAFLEIAVSLGVYGVKAHEEWEAGVQGRLRFFWGYWIGVLGVGLTLLAVFFNIFAGCGGRSDGYQRGEPV